jgi:hypothetical protein
MQRLYQLLRLLVLMTPDDDTQWLVRKDFQASRRCLSEDTARIRLERLKITTKKSQNSHYRKQNLNISLEHCPCLALPDSCRKEFANRFHA